MLTFCMITKSYPFTRFYILYQAAVFNPFFNNKNHVQKKRSFNQLGIVKSNKNLLYSGILRDKTMDDKLMYISN